ncbi:MAG: hypothetical protein IKK09_01615 [Clostridia bacterium]|nr:hypothetical protein [Clostridia bacterium]
MFKVSYISNNAILQKSFKTEATAIEWIANTASIKPLKLLAWDDDIGCYSTVKTFSNDYGTATATTLFKTVFA